jgi:hypothetical protein
MLLQLIKILSLVLFIRHLTLCHLSDVHASRLISKKKPNNQTSDETTDETTKIQQLVKDGVSLTNKILNSHDKCLCFHLSFRYTMLVY